MSVTTTTNHHSTSPRGSPTDLSVHLIHLGISAARRALIEPTRIQAERHLRIAAACIGRLDELRSAFLTSGKSNHPGSKYGPALTANRPDKRAAAGTLGDAKCRASLNKA